MQLSVVDDEDGDDKDIDDVNFKNTLVASMFSLYKKVELCFHK